MEKKIKTEGYFSTRLKYDEKRALLWESLWRFCFSKLINNSSSVIELGAGYCDFINSVNAKRRIAVDIWEGFTKYAEDGVECFVESAKALPFVESKTIDIIFASNLVEHLSQEEFVTMLSECKRILRAGGKLILLQPNYRFCYKRYFDDYTHKSIWSDISIKDFLLAYDWKILNIQKRFLPLTIKSKLPVSPLLIWAYINSPLKPFAGQMLIVAGKH